MGNGKVSPESECIDKRQGKLRLGLQRKLQTEKYQNLVISYDLEENLEWESLTERNKKVMNWQSVLTTEFKEVCDRIMKELGLSHIKAYVEDGPDYSPVPGAPTELDNLDGLDILGD